MKKILFLILLASVGSINSFAQTTIFVDSAATGLNNGTSWTNAYNSLSDALHYCWQTPMVDSVLVAKGTYSPGHRAYNMQPNRTGIESTNSDTVFHVRTGLNVLGGYANGGSAFPNYTSNKTILVAYEWTAIYIDSSSNWSAVNDTTSIIGLSTLRAPFVTGSIGFNVNGNNYSVFPSTTNHNYNYYTNALIAKTTVLIKHLSDDMSILADSCNIYIDSCSFIETVPFQAVQEDGIRLFHCNALISNSLFKDQMGFNGPCVIAKTGANKSIHFANNQFINDTAIYSGGAIQAEGLGTFIFTANVFNHCVANKINSVSIGSGGAIELIGAGTFRFIDNLFIDCFARKYGGAIIASAGSLYFENNVFHNNFCYYSALTLQNGVDTFLCYQNLFSNNSYGIIQSSAHYNEITNNTFYNNFTNDFGTYTTRGIDIVNFLNPNIIAKINNNIFKNTRSTFMTPNTVEGCDLNITVDTFLSNIDHNIFTGDSSAQYNGVYQTATNNTATNCQYGIYPGFADTTNLVGPDGFWGTADDGLRLSDTSIAINAGLPNVLPSYITKDIKDDNRIHNGVIDIGAYEKASTFPNPQINAGPTPTASTQQFKTTICSSIGTTTLGINNPPIGPSIWGVLNPGNTIVPYNNIDSTMSFSTPSLGTYSLRVNFANAVDTNYYDQPFLVDSGIVTFSISQIGTAVAAGLPVNFLANPVGFFTNEVYQWQLNGVNVGMNSPYYTLSNASPNDTVQCIFSYLSACNSTTQTIASNTIFILPTIIIQILHNNLSSILLYPNPTSNELIIASQKDGNNIQEIIVRDMVGKILLKENYTATKEVKLSLAHLANGQYHLLIKTTEGSAIRKVQVLR